MYHIWVSFVYFLKVDIMISCLVIVYPKDSDTLTSDHI